MKGQIITPFLVWAEININSWCLNKISRYLEIKISHIFHFWITQNGGRIMASRFTCVQKTINIFSTLYSGGSVGELHDTPFLVPIVRRNGRSSKDVSKAIHRVECIVKDVFLLFFLYILGFVSLDYSNTTTISQSQTAIWNLINHVLKFILDQH